MDHQQSGDDVVVISDGTADDGELPVHDEPMQLQQQDDQQQNIQVLISPMIHQPRLVPAQIGVSYPPPGGSYPPPFHRQPPSTVPRLVPAQIGVSYPPPGGSYPPPFHRKPPSTVPRLVPAQIGVSNQQSYFIGNDGYYYPSTDSEYYGMFQNEDAAGGTEELVEGAVGREPVCRPARGPAEVAVGREPGRQPARGPAGGAVGREPGRRPEDDEGYKAWLTFYDQRRHNMTLANNTCVRLAIDVLPDMPDSDPTFPVAPTVPNEDGNGFKYSPVDSLTRRSMLATYRNQLHQWQERKRPAFMERLHQIYDSVYPFKIPDDVLNEIDTVSHFAKSEVNYARNRIRLINNRLGKFDAISQISAAMKQKDEVERTLVEQQKALAEAEKTTAELSNLKQVEIAELVDTFQKKAKESDMIIQQHEEQITALRQAREQDQAKLKEQTVKLVASSSFGLASVEFDQAVTATLQNEGRLAAQAQSEIFKFVPKPPPDTVEWQYVKSSDGRRIPLGTGIYGKVFLAVRNDQLCAVKVFNSDKYKESDAAVFLATQLEYGMLSLCSSAGVSPRAITPIRTTRDKPMCNALLMELVTSYHHSSTKLLIDGAVCGSLPIAMNLRKYWLELGKIPSSLCPLLNKFWCDDVNKEQALNFLFMDDTIDAVRFIHSKGVVHCDLKAANILLRGGITRVTCLVSDYGSAVHTKDRYAQQPTHQSGKKRFSVTEQLPPEKAWIAPELTGPFPVPASQPSDIFSFGFLVQQALKSVWLDRSGVDEGSFMHNNILPVTAGKTTTQVVRADRRATADNISRMFKDQIQERTRLEPGRYSGFKIARYSSVVPDVSNLPPPKK